jgi:ribosomal protein L37AE/L43A
VSRSYAEEVRDDELPELDDVQRELPPCPVCGEPLRPEILDDERFLVIWSCLGCGLVRANDPFG